MLVKNNTHYFSLFNKVFNIVPDNDSWQFESSKRLSYGQRLYWEYKYCKSVGGQAFFYTFTYNDKSLPHFSFDRYNPDTLEYEPCSIPCFNYSDIRLITNGIISKVLRRKFGSQLRYFVACERGEGKGYRGKGLNPHYHVIFFVFPLSDKIRKPTDVPYKRISPIQFCHLCKCTWQYQSTFNKSDYVVADYKTAKFGHCQPGNDLGLISDFDALSYVTKYVVKDSAQSSDDLAVRNYYEHYFTELGITYHSLYCYYDYLRFTGSVVDRADFLERSGLDLYFGWRSLTGRRDVSFYKYLTLQSPVDFSYFWNEFMNYFKSLYLPNIISKSYRDYVNTFGAKVRCSKSLGIYGLSFVHDIDSEPHFVLDKSDEVVSQPICLYYYRKLYMNIVRCPNTGNVLYVLNDNGINLKCRKLHSVIDSFFSSVFDVFNSLSNNPTSSPTWSFLLSKDVSYDKFCLIHSDPDFVDLLYRFSVYRNVYQYRFYSDDSDISLTSSLFSDDIVSDYRKFISSNFYTTDYNELCLYTLSQSFARKFISFNLHPVFSSYIHKFEFIEEIYQLYNRFIGDLKKKSFAESVNLRKSLNAVKYSSVN